MLSVTNLQVTYDRAVEAVRDVSLQVGAGRIVALLGSNGAGKSTVLKAISGVLYPEEGEVTGGSIRYADAALDRCAPHEIVRRGIVQVPEGRRLFDTLTVEENLRMGGYLRPAAQEAEAMARVFELFPAIRARYPVTDERAIVGESPRPRATSTSGRAATMPSWRPSPARSRRRSVPCPARPRPMPSASPAAISSMSCPTAASSLSTAS